MFAEHGGSCRVLLMVTLLVAVSAGAPEARAQIAPPSLDNPFQIPDLRHIAPPATDREGVSATLKILVILTVLTLAPSILVMTTCFARIMIVLALMRQALATPQLPPSQILVGLSLFMTFLVMSPTYTLIYNDALSPYLNNEAGMTQAKAFDIAGGHMRHFMFTQIERTGNEEDIYLFLEYSQGRQIPTSETVMPNDVPTTVLVPAFILSELKTAFVMGFRIYLPFLVIDMVIASILISMGMLMLPPVLISLPFKILLFVLADGWHLVAGSLLASFG